MRWRPCRSRPKRLPKEQRGSCRRQARPPQATHRDRRFNTALACAAPPRGAPAPLRPGAPFIEQLARRRQAPAWRPRRPHRLTCPTHRRQAPAWRPSRPHCRTSRGKDHWQQRSTAQRSLAGALLHFGAAVGYISVRPTRTSTVRCLKQGTARPPWPASRLAAGAQPAAMPASRATRETANNKKGIPPPSGASPAPRSATPAPRRRRARSTAKLTRNGVVPGWPQRLPDCHGDAEDDDGQHLTPAQREPVSACLQPGAGVGHTTARLNGTTTTSSPTTGKARPPTTGKARPPPPASSLAPDCSTHAAARRLDHNWQRQQEPRELASGPAVGYAVVADVDKEMRHTANGGTSPAST